MLSIAIFFLMTVMITAVAQAQPVYRGSIVNINNYTYNLSEITISGNTVFHCRLQDTLFTLPFDKVQSVTITAGGESPYKGYVLADFVLTTGNQAQVYLNIENYRIEGIEENFNIRVKFPLTEIQSLQFIYDQQTTPSP